MNPFTDFGFKKIFGEEACKPLLIDFLNALLPEVHKITQLSFKNIEHFGQSVADRKAIYDLYCEDEKGEKFIVELQKAKQNYFRERTIYYSTFPIHEQAEKGDWDFNLNAIFCIGILDFTFDDYESEPEKSEVLHTIKLKNQHGKTFYDKLTYLYLEMPNFKKTESELTTRLDQWLYFIKHLEDFDSIPLLFKDEVFVQAFEKAKLANFGKSEWDSYHASLKTFRDNKNTFDYAKQTAFSEGRLEGLQAGLLEGKKEGIQEGILKGEIMGKLEVKHEIAKNALKKGLAVKDISELTGLSESEIKALIK